MLVLNPHLSLLINSLSFLTLAAATFDGIKSTEIFYYNIINFFEVSLTRANYIKSLTTTELLKQTEKYVLPIFYEFFLLRT